MIYTEKTKKAMEMCFMAHDAQNDIGGTPYVFHPMHLAEQMTDETTTVVALLHDFLEDSFFTAEDVAAEFGPEVAGAVMLLTRAKGTPYADYIRAIKPNPIARAVKLADLRHNSDTTRLYPRYIETEDTQRRLKKYKEAIEVLEAE